MAVSQICVLNLNYEAAISVLQRALTLVSDRERAQKLDAAGAYSSLAALLLMARNYQEALSAVAKARDLAPTNVFYELQELALKVAAGVTAAAGLLDRIADVLIQRIPSAGDEAEFLRGTIEIIRAIRSPADLKKYIGSFGGRDMKGPENPPGGGAQRHREMPGGGQSRDAAVHFFRATQFLNAGRLKAALAEAHKALRINPRSVEVLCTKAQVLATLGRVDEARRELTKAERFNPRFPNIYWLRGCILMGTDENAAEAVAEFEKCYELAYPRIPLDNTFCEALFALGRDDEVMTLLKDAMLDSTDPSIFLIRSMYFKRHRELDLALLDANQAVSLLESGPEAFAIANHIYSERGEVRWAMGDGRGAVEDLERALELTGEAAFARKNYAARLEAFRNTSAPLEEESGLSNVIQPESTQT